MNPVEALRLDFAGRTVVVTAAAQGQGLAAATRFAKLGATVFMVDSSSDLESSVDAVRAAGGEAHGIPADVADERDWGAVAAWASSTGRVDVLVNVVPFGRGAGVLDTEGAEWADALGTGVVAAALGTKVIGRRMVEQGRGCIVNVSSLAGFGGHWSAAPTVAAWGVRGLTRVTAAELGRHGVRCVGVETGLSEPSGLLDEVLRSAVLEQTPAVLPTLADVAATVAFLASDAASYVNGVDVVVDGGLLVSSPFREIRNRIASWDLASETNKR